MNSYIHMMVELFKFILMMGVVFVVILGCCALAWHVLIWVYNKLRPYGLSEDKEMQRDLETASIFLGLVLAGVLIVPPILVFGPKYTEDPETVKAQKASEDAAFDSIIGTNSNNAAKTAAVNTETDAQYEEGQTAAANGIPCEACPYFPSHYDPDYTLLRERWLKGWINKTIELKKGTAQ